MDGYITIGTELDTKQFDKQILALERKANELEDMLSKKKEIGLSSREVAEVEVELEKVRNKLVQLNQQKAKLNTPISTGIQGINDLGKSFENSIKKASRLVLSIFGIRSAYMALRRASSDLSTYDEQYATNLEYIRYVLTQAIAPVLRYIVNLAMTLLTYINAIAQAWFGVNLFANGSAENFKKMKTQAGGISKAVKEIKKQLLGFDEVNILTADSDTGTEAGAGGTGIPMPSMDLSKLDVPIPKWLEWLLSHGETVIKILKLLGATIAGLKIANFIKNLGLLGANFGKFQKLLLGLGIGAIIYGIYETIKGIIEFIKDPSLENLSNILTGIATILGGIALSMLAIDALNPVGWIMLIVAAVVALAAVIVKNWDKIKDTLAPVGQWIYDNIIKPVATFFEGLWETIKEIFSPVFGFFKSLFDTVFENIKIGIDNAKKLFEFLWESIKTIFEPVVNFFRDTFIKAYNLVKAVFEPIVTFFAGIWDRIKGKLQEFGAKVGETIGFAFKNVINGVLGAIEAILNTPINAINALIGAINGIPGINLEPFQTFSLPRLKVGGIVNMPNKGRLIGGQAIAAESGAERSNSFDGYTGNANFR